MRFRFVFFLIIIVVAISGGNFLYAQAASDGQSLNVGYTVPAINIGWPPPPWEEGPPTISDVASSTTYTSAIITWSANSLGGIKDSALVYGLTTSYGTSAFIMGNYRVNLMALATGTVYYFKISETGNTGLTTNYAGYFATQVYVPPPDIAPPVISNIQITRGATTSSISWQTDELADSQVNYGLTAFYGNTVIDSAKVTGHTLLLSSLLPNTTYHYRLLSSDFSGNTAKTNDATFTTLKDNIPPPDVSNLQIATTSNTISLTWSNPDLAMVPDFAGVTVVRKVNSQSTGITDGEVVYTGPAETLTDSDVLTDVNYFYTVFSFDTSGNYSPGVFGNGKMIPPPSSEICNNGIDDNNNGLTDCADPACVNSPTCQVPLSVEICNNGIDDDGNGLIDCADLTCASKAECLGILPTIVEICGNGVDDNNNGLMDCADPACVNDSSCIAPPLPPPPPPYIPPVSTVPSFVKINISDLSLLTGDRQIILVPKDEVITSLTGSSLTIGLPKKILTGTPISLVVKVDGQDQHQFNYAAQTETYYADIIFPDVGRHQASLEIDYGANQMDSVIIGLESLGAGVITDDNGPVSGAEVILYKEDGSKFSAEIYGERNPLLTNVNGAYGWVAPNGRYYLKANKDGYYRYASAIFGVDNNVVNKSFSLVAIPPPLAQVIEPTAPLEENIAKVAKNLIQKTTASTKLVAQDIIETVKVAQDFANKPEVKNVASRVVAPTALGVMIVGSIPLISWVDLLALLRLLFLQPLLLLGLRKREKWGKVYDSLSKLPISLAIIRLIEATTNRVAQSKVTDQQGRYAFLTNPGKYRLEVLKKDMFFPSQFLKEFKSDGRMIDLYHGEIIEVSEKDTLITANIPLDPVGEHKKPFRLVWEKVARRLQTGLSWVGLLVTAVSLYISPRWYVWLLLAAHITFFFLFRRLAQPPKLKSWGIVYDKVSKKPLGRAVARLFSLQFNKLVATQVTDNRGCYYFLAGDNKYYATYEHSDYLPHKTDIIDLTGKEAETISLNIGLEKEK